MRTEGEPDRLLLQLLDQMITLGETARELKCQLAGDGHKAEMLKYIKEELKHPAEK